jgi:hypothetical protein
MFEESLVPREIERGELFPEGIPFESGDLDKSQDYICALKETLPLAKSDEEMVAMEVLAALNVAGVEESAEISKVLTNALLNNPAEKEKAIMVAQQILRSIVN